MSIWNILQMAGTSAPVHYDIYGTAMPNTTFALKFNATLDSAYTATITSDAQGNWGFKNNGYFNELKNLSSFIQPSAKATVRTIVFDESFKNSVATWDLQNLSTSFKGAMLLESVEFPSNFDTSNVVSTKQMFDGCFLLQKVDMKYFNLSNVGSVAYGNMDNMFNDCSSLEQILGMTSETSHFTYPTSPNSTSYMFAGCANLESYDFSNFVTNFLDSVDYMFNGIDTTGISKTIDISGLNLTYLATEYEYENFVPNLSEITVKYSTSKVPAGILTAFNNVNWVAAS